jgi:hypothetical protein
LFGGETTLFFEIVIPAWVEKWKPSSLNASSAWAIAGAPYASTRLKTIALISRLFSA